MIIDKNKFNDFFDKLPQENREIATSLIDELLFIQKTLEELKNSIDTDGAVIEKQTGNGYKTVCENPALKGYNTTIKSYNTTCKTLLAYLPKLREVEEIDEFQAFCMGKLQNRATTNPNTAN